MWVTLHLANGKTRNCEVHDRSWTTGTEIDYVHTRGDKASFRGRFRVTSEQPPEAQYVSPIPYNQTCAEVVYSAK